MTAGLRCGVLLSRHWEQYGFKLVCTSPLFHIDDLCPFTEGSCILNCSKLVPAQRPCLRPLFENKGGKDAGDLRGRLL